VGTQCLRVGGADLRATARSSIVQRTPGGDVTRGEDGRGRAEGGAQTAGMERESKEGRDRLSMRVEYRERRSGER
jgi:hypothetical protein